MLLKNLLSSFCLLFVFTLSAQLIDWEPEITVAENTYGNVRPRIVLNKDQNPVVLFGKSSLGLFVSKFENNAFQIPIQINDPNTLPYITNWTSADFAAYGDTLGVVYKVNPLETGKIYLQYSYDGGTSFTDTIPILSPQSGVTWLPNIHFDSNGNTLVSYMVHDAIWSNPRYALQRTTDFGLTFEPEVNLSSGIVEEACDCCPAELIGDDQNQVLLFRNNSQNIRDVYAVRSLDNTFSSLQSINTEELNWAVNSCPSTAPDGIISNNTLMSVAASRASGKFRVYLSELLLNDSITRVNTDSIMPPENYNGSQNFPRISSSNDTVVLVWQESNPSNYDVYLSYTLNGSPDELMSSKEQINSDPAGAQLNPDVVVHNGFVHAIYQDNNGGVVKYRRGKFSALGIEESIESLVNLFPNPTNEYIVLDFPSAQENTRYLITDFNGKTVLKGTLHAYDKMINIEKLESGKYTIRIGSELKSFVKN